MLNHCRKSMRFSSFATLWYCSKVCFRHLALFHAHMVNEHEEAFHGIHSWLYSSAQTNTTTATLSCNTNIADYISILWAIFSVLLSVRNTVNANNASPLLTDCAATLLQNVSNFTTTYLKQKITSINIIITILTHTHTHTHTHTGQ